MTQPDQYFPDTATNALSFADYAATTQEDWEDQIHGDTASHFNIAEIAFETLLDWVEQIPLIGPAIVQVITGIEGTLDFLGDWFFDLRKLLNFPDLGSGIDPLGWATEFIENILNPTGLLTTLSEVGEAIAEAIQDLIQNLLNGLQPINALNLFGQILPGLFSNLPLGAITDEQPNLLPAGNFPNLASISDNPKWVYDATVTRTADSTGSARTTANGTVRALRSRVVAVTANQPLSASTAVKCAGLVASGAPFHLDMVRFSGTVDSPTQIGIDRLATANPGNGSHDWIALTKGGITVPSGTTCVCLRLVVDATATAGSVWFDEGVLKQTGTLQMGWVGGLIEQFTRIFNVFGPGGVIEEMEQAWENLLKLFGLNDLLGNLNPATIWAKIVEFFINPLGFFANLVDGILPDSQKPQWLQDLNDGIANLFNGASDVGTGIANAVQSLTGIWGAGQSAQRSADDANIGVQIIKARLDAPGVVGFDEFDYSSANTLPADKYALVSDGPGGGHYGPNGKGQLVWKPSGFSPRSKIYKRTDQPLDTDNGVVTGVWSTRVKDPLFSDGYGYLCGRMYASNNDTRIQARIDNNNAVIQAVTSGVVTSIGSSQAVDTSDGDVWEFWYGTLTNAYVFWLKQNGNVVMVREDTGRISLRGPEYRMCGLGGRADNYAAIFQIAPPTWNGWTWRDQNAAAA